MHWKETFLYNGKPLYYNRIDYNNAAERAIEVPIAFDFLVNLKEKSKILEIGNVLANYENTLSDYLGIRQRRIVDKYEVALGVDNIDVMDIPDTEKYDAIVSISTVEHVGQEGYRYPTAFQDCEAPLKAIAKIYHLLKLGGNALITVPFGKLTKGIDFIQFSSEYLSLLSTKYKVPERAMSISWFRRISTAINVANPRQLWVQEKESELSNAEYNWPWPYSNGLAAIALTKISNDFTLNLTLPPEPLVYNRPINEKISEDLFRETYLILERLRDINLIIFPRWSESKDSLYQDLNCIIKSLLTHPDCIYLSLLVESSEIDEEDADLILSDILMNIFSVEPVDATDELEIILLGKLDRLQWQAFLPQVHWHVLLEAENESFVTEMGVQSIPTCRIEELSSKRANMLETGLWELN